MVGVLARIREPRRRWNGPGFGRQEGVDMAQRTCAVDGCDGVVNARGMCGRHYTRMMRHGDPLGGGRNQTRNHRRPPGTPERQCSVGECERRAISFGWCRMHFLRWKRHGDPLIQGRLVGDTVARFWSKVDKNGPIPDYAPHLGPCWLWTGGKSSKRAPYGQFRLPDRLVLSHKWAWEAENGPVPGGLELDHLCRVQPCVRPSHLQAVPHRTNVLRGMAPAAIAYRKRTGGAP